MSTAGPLRGDAEGLGASAINAKNINIGCLGRRCRRSRCAHHQRKKYLWQAPGKHARGVGESTNNAKNVDGGPLGGGNRGMRAPTINAINVDGGPLGRQCRRSGSSHHQHKKNIDGGPPGKRCRGVKVLTIKAKKL
jgi:hypothetical protein